MTISAEQIQELFGKTKVWEIYVIKRPEKSLEGYFEHTLWCMRNLTPNVVIAMNHTLKQVTEERAGKNEPTRCLFCCETTFIKEEPAYLAIVMPAVEPGPAMGLLICEKCSKGKENDLEAAVGYKLGALPTQQGNA